MPVCVVEQLKWSMPAVRKEKSRGRGLHSRDGVRDEGVAPWFGDYGNGRSGSAIVMNSHS